MTNTQPPLPGPICPQCNCPARSLTVLNAQFAPLIMCQTPGCSMFARAISPDAWDRIANEGLKLEGDGNVGY